MSYKGGCRAEFGIIEELDVEKDYGDYNPEQYRCKTICDDAINDWWKSLEKMPSYFHSYNRPASALARWGVTIIPPSSLELFIRVIITETKNEFRTDALEIVALLEEARTRNKFVIHYGI